MYIFYKAFKTRYYILYGDKLIEILRLSNKHYLYIFYTRVAKKTTKYFLITSATSNLHPIVFTLSESRTLEFKTNC